MTDDELQALIEALHLATASPERFRVLDFAARHESFGVGDVARAAGRDWTTARAQIKALAAKGLLDAPGVRRYAISVTGQDIHGRISRSTGVPAAAAELIGLRLVGIALARKTDPAGVVAALGEAATVLHTDGDLNLVALYKDEPDLVEMVRFRLEQLGVRVALRARVAKVVDALAIAD